VIFAECKPIDELVDKLRPYKKVLLAGCATCVAECAAGGEREVDTLAPLLRMALKKQGHSVEIVTATLEKQCEWEFVEQLAEQVAEVDAVMSIACGIGVQALAERLGEWATGLLALGLFAAGLSSAITAPLAAALSVRGFLHEVGADGSRAGPADRWQETGWRYRAVWGGVLLFGLGFGLVGVAPIPAIVLAQAFNGVLLPLLATYLWIAVNDRSLVGSAYLVGPVANIWLGLCVLLTCLLGAAGVLRAGFRVIDRAPPGQGTLLGAGAILVACLVFPVLAKIRQGRSRPDPES